jgi:uncharacterized protein
MDWLHVSFPVSGVETGLWLPVLVALGVSFFTSMVGVSGAFLLLPFQMSVLHYTAPSVSATNLVFNLIATPGGIYRYWREGRLVWPLVTIILLGTLPGIVIGYYVRVWLLADVQTFQLFVGAVLAYVAYRLLAGHIAGERHIPHADPSRAPRVQALRLSLTRTRFAFGGETYGFGTAGMFTLALVVGVIGGIYGIGGGAIIAPFCVAFFGLPIHAVAGAALAGTLFTSLAGVLLYSVLPAPAGMATQPDWALGLLFGLGGLAGMYLGARCQKYVPQRTLRLMLGALVGLLALHYLASPWR